MKQEVDTKELEDWTGTDWLHVPTEMVSRLRPIWEGYPNHPTHMARLTKAEKQALMIQGAGQDMKQLNDYFSIHGAEWKKRRDEALQEFLRNQP